MIDLYSHNDITMERDIERINAHLRKGKRRSLYAGDNRKCTVSRSGHAER